jgi:hypothetical protein
MRLFSFKDHSEELAHNGLALRAANPEVPLWFGTALGGLCASEELAQNGGGRETVSGGARRTLCASKEVPRLFSSD